MKDEINIPLLKVEDLVTATERIGKYSLLRDLQAREFNEAIVSRLARGRNNLKCEKCGKEFSVEISTNGSLNCPECK